MNSVLEEYFYDKYSNMYFLNSTRYYRKIVNILKRYRKGKKCLEYEKKLAFKHLKDFYIGEKINLFLDFFSDRSISYDEKINYLLLPTSELFDNIFFNKLKMYDDMELTEIISEIDDLISTNLYDDIHVYLKENRINDKKVIYQYSRYYMEDPAVGREKEIDNIFNTIFNNKDKKPLLFIGNEGIEGDILVDGINYRLYDNSNKTAADTIMLRTDFDVLNKVLLNLSFIDCKYNEKDNPNIFFDILNSHSNVILVVDNISSLQQLVRYIKFYSPLNFTLIANIKYDVYKEAMLNDNSIINEFIPFIVEEPSSEELEKILIESIKYYSYRYKVKISNKLTKNIAKSLTIYTSPKYRNEFTQLCNPELSNTIIHNAFKSAKSYDMNKISKSYFVDAYKNVDNLIGKFDIIKE